MLQPTNVGVGIGELVVLIIEWVVFLSLLAVESRLALARSSVSEGNED